MLYSHEIDETAQVVETDDQFLSMKDFSGYTQEEIDTLENLDTTTSGICPLVLLSGGENNRTDLLREFRDHFLKKTPVGKEYISLFYKHSLEITSIIIKNPKIRFQSERVLNLVIPLIQSSMENNTIILDRETINNIIGLCKDIQKKASPKLKQATAMLIKNLNDKTLCYSLQPDMSE